MKKQPNVLYFEAVGGDYELNEMSDIGYYRICTAFKDNAGVPYYLDISNTYKRDERMKAIDDWNTHVEYLFEIKEEIGRYRETDKIIDELRYNKNAIVRWINEMFGCDFDSMEVLDQYYGYDASGDFKKYNLMENHKVDHEQASLRREAFNKIDMEYRTALNERYSITHMVDMDDVSITVDCFAEKRLREAQRINRYTKVFIAKNDNEWCSCKVKYREGVANIERGIVCKTCDKLIKQEPERMVIT